MLTHKHDGTLLGPVNVQKHAQNVKAVVHNIFLCPPTHPPICHWLGGGDGYFQCKKSHWKLEWKDFDRNMAKRFYLIIKPATSHKKKGPITLKASKTFWLQCVFLAKKTWQNWVWTSAMGLCQPAPFYRNKDSNLLIRNWVETRSREEWYLQVIWNLHKKLWYGKKLKVDLIHLPATKIVWVVWLPVNENRHFCCDFYITTADFQMKERMYVPIWIRKNKPSWSSMRQMETEKIK